MRQNFDLRSFGRDQRGNVAVMFGACAIPLLLLMGGAVDLSLYANYKADLSNATDAAALALARHTDDYSDECPNNGDTCPKATTFVQNYVSSFKLTDGRFSIGSTTVTRANDGFLVSTDATMRTVFMPFGDLAQAGRGVKTMAVSLNTGVVSESNRIELALVLDNTGSMNCPNTVTYDCAAAWDTNNANTTNWANYTTNTTRMYAVKKSATTLVDTLMKDNMSDPDLVKIALVPFEGMVNVGYTSGPSNSWATPPSWIAWNTTWGAQATSTYEGVNFEQNSGKNVTHAALFKKLNTAWAGCVEMRAGSAYELTDATPSTSIANSLYTPFFWPDEPDSATTAGSSGATRNNSKNGSTTYTYTNDYLNDKQPFTNDPAGAQKYLNKYNASPTYWTGRNDTTAMPYEYGPNRGCPAPIKPLTSATAAGKTALKSAISSMIAYWATGTFIPTGLVWGWHVLSPNEPFTQGTKPGDDHYEQTVKAMVLLTDGDNDVSPGGTKVNYYSVNDNNNGSRYSAYNYLNTVVSGSRRLGSSISAASTTLDTKTSTICTSIKAAGIRLYTISLGSVSSDSQTMLSNCATLDNGKRLYYSSPSTSDLEGIFKRIGDDLSNLHLSS